MTFNVGAIIKAKGFILDANIGGDTYIAAYPGCPGMVERVNPMGPGSGYTVRWFGGATCDVNEEWIERYSTGFDDVFCAVGNASGHVT